MTLEEILKKDPEAVKYVENILKWRGHKGYSIALSVKEFANYLWDEHEFETEEYC